MGTETRVTHTHTHTRAMSRRNPVSSTLVSGWAACASSDKAGGTSSGLSFYPRDFPFTDTRVLWLLYIPIKFLNPSYFFFFFFFIYKPIFILSTSAKKRCDFSHITTRKYNYKKNLRQFFRICIFVSNFLYFFFIFSHFLCISFFYFLHFFISIFFFFYFFLFFIFLFFVLTNFYFQRIQSNLLKWDAIFFFYILVYRNLKTF